MEYSEIIVQFAAQTRRGVRARTAMYDGTGAATICQMASNVHVCTPIWKQCFPVGKHTISCKLLSMGVNALNIYDLYTVC